MDPLITELIKAIPNFAFASLGYLLGWRIYQDSQKRIDRLIDAILDMCGDDDPAALRARVNGKQP